MVARTCAGFAALFSGRNLRPLTIGMSLMLFQQITGQPSVLYYATEIFEKAGFASQADASKVSVGLGFFKLVMTGTQELARTTIACAQAMLLSRAVRGCIKLWSFLSQLSTAVLQRVGTTTLHSSELHAGEHVGQLDTAQEAMASLGRDHQCR